MDGYQLLAKIDVTIWKACNTLRNNIQSENYRDYVVIMLFAKYLSDIYKEEKEKAEQKYNGDKERIERALSRSRFILKDDCTFDYLYQKRNENNIGEIINKALEKIIILNKTKLSNLFSEVDFNSEAVFGKPKEKNEILKQLLEDFNKLEIDLKLSEAERLDILGKAYEYLITSSAGNANKKEAGFYTPIQVSKLLAKLVALEENDRIYDPACGAGGLLLKVAEELKSEKFSIYGQEIDRATYNLCRINMILHGIDDAHIEWGDTLANPLHLQNGELMKFNVIVSNPPFSLNNWDKGFKNTDTSTIDDYKKMEAYRDARFKYGIPPKNIGDYAFIQHMLASLDYEGRMAVVLPHGVLFRGASEGIIRQRILEDNLIDAVIGLPGNLLYGTSIPITIVIFKKDRRRREVLFIEASREYEKSKNQNILTKENIEKILNTYMNYEEIENYSRVVTMEEIEKNEYNLNIKRYVDIFCDNEEINIEETRENIKEIEKKIYLLEKELQDSLRELNL